MSISSSTNKRQRGVAMVELAILILLLFILVLGVTEVGRAVFFQHKLTKATEAGARYLGRAWDAVDQENCSTATGWAAAETAAANLAVFGSVAGGSDPAIPGFEVAQVTSSAAAVDVPDVGMVCVVRMEVAVPYQGMFIIRDGGGGFLPPIILGGGGGGRTWLLTAASEERYVGE
jgi:hypothetical protein